MEGSTKRGKHLEAVNPLDNKDCVLFLGTKRLGGRRCCEQGVEACIRYGGAVAKKV
jgi:hypothetical protein